MRTLIPVLTLLLVTACGGGEEQRATAASAASLGSDAIVLRVPADGGALRAYRYPALDTLIWQSRAALPPDVRVLGFSIDGGVLALQDGAGFAWRLTLGSGLLERAYKTPLVDAASVDGTSIFGSADGGVLRLVATEAVPWTVRGSGTLAQLQPTRDGGVLLIGHDGGHTVLSRFRPPAATPSDTTVLDGTARLISAAGGDRYYLSDGPRQLISIRSRNLEQLGTIAIGDSIIATASSPSGDRVYVLGRDDDETRVQVINKYSDEIVTSIEMPSDASALRMDPLGRYLLVRHGGLRDSVLIVGIATDAVVGRFASPWRADLPMVLPDGRLAALRGDDVITLEAGEFSPVFIAPGGARDIWTVVQWNGFRRRPGDAPLRATAGRVDTAEKPKTPDSAATAPVPAPAPVPAATAADSNAPIAPRPAAPAESLPPTRSRRDSVRRAAARADSARKAAALRADSARRGIRPDTQRGRDRNARTAEPANQTLGERGSFVVQFAALKAEGPARQLAGAIKANGEQARVVTTVSNGIPLYRVILGPYRSRADAERAGQSAGRDYWVFEGGSN